MKTKTEKKVTALLTGVLLLGVTTTSVLAASGMVHEGGMHDSRVLAQMGITPEQMAKINADCSQWAQKVVKTQPAQPEKSTNNLRFNSEDGWVPGW